MATSRFFCVEFDDIVEVCWPTLIKLRVACKYVIAIGLDDHAVQRHAVELFHVTTISLLCGAANAYALIPFHYISW